MKPENEEQENELIALAKILMTCKDPSHDFEHAMKVVKNAKIIAEKEGGDLEIIIPAALFHDFVVYPKNDPKSKYSAHVSAKLAGDILKGFSDPFTANLVYDAEKLKRIQEAIREHSYCNGIRPKTLESKIVQDADRLEATGASAIMRTFCSSGQMKRQLYNPEDPFCENRDPDTKKYGLDLFYKRLLKVKDLMNTKTAKELAEKRTQFLYQFLEQFKTEI